LRVPRDWAEITFFPLFLFGAPPPPPPRFPLVVEFFEKKPFALFFGGGTSWGRSVYISKGLFPFHRAFFPVNRTGKSPPYPLPRSFLDSFFRLSVPAKGFFTKCPAHFFFIACQRPSPLFLGPLFSKYRALPLWILVRVRVWEMPLVGRVSWLTYSGNCSLFIPRVCGPDF